MDVRSRQTMSVGRIAFRGS